MLATFADHVGTVCPLDNDGKFRITKTAAMADVHDVGSFDITLG
jgi:hypothetical protein